MKNIVVLLIIVFLTYSAVAESDLVKVESAKLAAKLVSDELKKKIPEVKINQEKLERSINENAESKHTEKNNSFNLLREETKKNIQKWYQDEIGKIVTSLEKDGQFSEEFKQELLKNSDLEIEKNLNKNFQPVFSNARQKSVKEQWQRLSYEAYPTEAEVEDAVLNNKTDSLKKIILDRSIQKQKEKVFEENKEALGTDIVSPAISNAVSQYKAQQSMVENSSGGSSILPEDVEKEILSDINSKIEQQKKSNPTKKTYNLFESVKKSISPRAESAATEKFRSVLSSMNFAAKEESIISVIKKDLVAHKYTGTSRKMCIDQLSGDIKKQALTNYCSKAPDKDQKKLMQFLEKVVSKDLSFKRSLDRIASDAVDASFGNARSKIQEEQFQQNFKPLFDKSWKPSEKEIEEQAAKSRPSIDKPLDIPGISSGEYDSNILIEETLLRVKNSEFAALEEGLSALKNQMKVSSSVQVAKSEELKTRSPLPDVNDFINEYIKDATSQWSKQGNTKYPNLFDSTREDCKLRAKYILPMEVKKREQQKKEEEIKVATPSIPSTDTTKSDANKPGIETAKTNTKDPNGGGKGPGLLGGGGGLELVALPTDIDAFVDIDFVGGSFFATILFPKEKDLQFIFNLGAQGVLESPDTLASMRNIQQLFKSWLRNLEINPDGADICLVIRVFDSRVHYGLVYEFRKCLFDASKVLEQRPDKEKIKIFVLDGLFNKQDKGNRKMPRQEINKNTLEKI